MTPRRLTTSILAFILALTLGCSAEPVEHNQNSSSPVDAGADTFVDEDVFGFDVYDSDDTDDVGADTSSPPPRWDCAPDLALDTERYAALEDVHGEDLLDELFLLVDGHNDRGYNQARDLLFSHLDVREDGMLECVFSGRRVYPDGTRTPDGFNTEHTWPQSRGSGQDPARNDLHHLFAVDAEANTARGNYEFGHVDCDESTCPWNMLEAFRGPSADDNRDPIYQVQPGRRGDVARAILYFSLRYGAAVSPEEEAVMRLWNCEDPPDDHERTRNDNVDQVQNNRNPFIDRPDFVDRIAEF